MTPEHLAEIRARVADPMGCYTQMYYEDAPALLAEIDRLNDSVKFLQDTIHGIRNASKAPF